MSNGMEFPFGELNLNGVPLNNSSSNTNMTSINTMGNNITMNQNTAPNNNMQQAQMQGMNMGMINPNSPQHMGNNGNNPITPSSLWGSALPFSFDALMSGNVGLGQNMPLVSHN